MVAEKQLTPAGCVVKCIPNPGPQDKWRPLHSWKPWCCPPLTHTNKSHFPVQKNSEKAKEISINHGLELGEKKKKSDHITPLLKTFQSPSKSLQGPMELHTLHIPLTSSPTTVSFIHSAPVTPATSPFPKKAISHRYCLLSLPGRIFSVIYTASSITSSPFKFLLRETYSVHPI